MKRLITLLLLLSSLNAFAESNHSSVPISTTIVKSGNVDLIMKSIGFLRSRASPTLSSEVEGSIISINTFEGQTIQKGQLLAKLNTANFIQIVNIEKADIKRLNALIKNQSRTVKRYRKLLKQRSASQDKLDENESLLMALKAQLSGATARLALAKINLKMTKIIAPVSGQIEKRIVSVGDYLKKGAPLFKISSTDILEAHLPFPEQLANHFKIGQTVRLNTVTTKQIIHATISALHPEIDRQNLSMEVIINFTNPGGWKPGASVSGSVIIETHSDAILIPTRSIIRRPAGNVVYLIEHNLAKQQLVTTGIQQNGKTEILTGLSAGQIIALDGASWLSNDVTVRIKGVSQ